MDRDHTHKFQVCTQRSSNFLITSYIAFLSTLGFHFWRTMCKKSSLSPPGFDFETTVCIVTHQINGLTCHVQQIKMQPKIQLHENEIMILLSTDMHASCLAAIAILPTHTSS